MISYIGQSEKVVRVNNGQKSKTFFSENSHHFQTHDFQPTPNFMKNQFQTPRPQKIESSRPEPKVIGETTIPKTQIFISKNPIENTYTLLLYPPRSRIQKTLCFL